jgi:hypothetical protein
MPAGSVRLPHVRWPANIGQKYPLQAGHPAASVTTAKLEYWPEFRRYYIGVLRRPAALRLNRFQKDD